MNHRWVYINGKFVPESEARVSIYDSALMFGDMVFEMTRSFNGKQFKLREHINRLYASMSYIRLSLPMTPEQMLQACNETIEKNKPAFSANDEHRLMINVTRGPLALYSEIFNGNIEPQVIIADFPLKWTVAAMAPLYDTGINAVIPSQRAIPAYLLEPKVKNRSRLPYLMANIEVSQVKGDNNWALLLDPDGFITEGTGSNFFMVKDGKIFTPEPRNILRGISRDYIFEIAAQLGLSVEERNLEQYDVITADEAFMTATPFCMIPITSLNGAKIGNGVRGPIFNLLIEKWGKNVGVNIESQIREFAAEITEKKSSAPTPYQFKT